jgi:hypothetical protein
MMGHRFRTIVVPLLLAGSATLVGPSAAAPLRYAGRNVELAVTELSNRTVRVALAQTRFEVLVVCGNARRSMEYAGQKVDVTIEAPRGRFHRGAD